MPGGSLFQPKPNFRLALATAISSPRSDLQINFGLRFRNPGHTRLFHLGVLFASTGTILPLSGTSELAYPLRRSPIELRHYVAPNFDLVNAIREDAQTIR